MKATNNVQKYVVATNQDLTNETLFSANFRVVTKEKKVFKMQCGHRPILDSILS